MTERQKELNSPKVKAFLEEHEAYLERKNKLINKLSMPIFKNSLSTDKDGEVYLSRESFISFLHAIANHILNDSKVTISVEPLLPEL